MTRFTTAAALTDEIETCLLILADRYPFHVVTDDATDGALFSTTGYVAEEGDQLIRVFRDRENSVTITRGDDTEFRLVVERDA